MLLAQVEPESSVGLVVVGSVVVALGVAPPVTLGTDLVVGCVRPERAGVASGISETGAELGGALGIAVLGSISVAVYRNELADAVPAGSGPTHPRHRRTRSAELSKPSRLSPMRSGQTCSEPQEAFTQGMQVAALTSAVVAPGAAAVVGVLLWRLGVSTEREEGSEAAADEASEMAQL